MPHVPMLVALVKTLLGETPVVITASKEAKNSRAGHKDMDLQIEAKRDAQAARLRFQHKCLAVMRTLARLPEVSECAAVRAFADELVASPFAEMWLGRVEEGVPGA